MRGDALLRRLHRILESIVGCYVDESEIQNQNSHTMVIYAEKLPPTLILDIDGSPSIIFLYIEVIFIHSINQKKK